MLKKLFTLTVFILGMFSIFSFTLLPVVAAPEAVQSLYLSSWKAKLVTNNSEHQGDAKVMWTAINEVDVYQYNVWRSKEDTEHYVLKETINATDPGMISVNNKYVYFDSTVKKGNTYFYKVEVVRTNGWNLETDDMKVIVPTATVKK